MMQQDNLRKMDCGRARGHILLAEFTKDDGSGGNGFVLSPEPLAHMESCASCRGFFLEVRDAARAVKTLEAKAPADFIEGLHEKLFRETPRPLLVFHVLKPAAAAALFLFASLTALTAFRQVLKPENLTSKIIGNFSRTASLKPQIVFSGKDWTHAVSSAQEKPELANKKARVKSMAYYGRQKRASSAVKHTAENKTLARENSMNLLHERMVQIQVKSDRTLDNVSLVLETEGDAFLEGESVDGKILTWIGSVSQHQPVAILVPVKAGGKKAVKIRTTVVTSEGEILHESVSFKESKKRPQIATTEDNAGGEKASGRFLVFIPSSKLMPKNLPSSGISVSVQAGSLALSDAGIENVAYVPNPGGSLELVFADSKIELTGAQVFPEKN